MGFCTSVQMQLVSVLSDDADGERLIQLGQTFNNSMLELVGHAFENLEKNWCAQALSQKKHARCGQTGHRSLRKDQLHLDIKHEIANVGTQVLIRASKTGL